MYMMIRFVLDFYNSDFIGHFFKDINEKGFITDGLQRRMSDHAWAYVAGIGAYDAYSPTAYV